MWDRRYSVWCGAALPLLTFCLLVKAKLWRPDTLFTITENVQIAEAKAWWNGRLDLPERKWDTALFNGRVYSHFPPMFSFVAAAIVPLFHGVPHWFIAGVLVLPVLMLAYALFYRQTGSVTGGVLLAIGLVCGTSLFPVIDKTLRGASPYYVNQTLATIGLLVMLFESFGRKRLWVLGLGLIISALSRQMTVAYLVPLSYLALRRSGGQERSGVGPQGPLPDPAPISPRTTSAVQVSSAAKSVRDGSERQGTSWWVSGGTGKRITMLLVTVLVVVIVPCTLNALKFGHPLDSGYMHVYTGRPEDAFSRDARRYGLFSAHYVPRNFYYANLGFPKVYRIEIAGEPEVHLRPNRMGTGIWWTTPLLLWLFVDVRSIVRAPLNRAWLVAAVLVGVGLLFYHSTGYQQRGFNRYSLDYVPVILALVAPRCMEGRRRWISMPMIAWSVVYFRWLI